MADSETLSIESALQRAEEFMRAGQPRDAIPLYGGIIEADGENVSALIGMGQAIIMLGDPAAAVHMLRAATNLSPDFASGHNSLGVALMGADDLDASADCFRRALELAPDDSGIHNNFATLRNRMGDYSGAEESFRKSLDLNPDNPDVEYNLGVLLLLLGRYEEGWPMYARRWQANQIALRKRQFEQPTWTGNALAGETVLVHAEQGLGDAIQFVRFLPMIAERGGRVVLECPPPLVELLSNVSGADFVIAAGDVPPPFDLHVPLMDLPGVLKISIAGIPAPVPYLSVPAKSVEAWRSRFPTEGGLRVGLVWAGNPAHRADRLRSIPASQFEPLLQLDDVNFFSLQIGEKAADLGKLPAASQVVSMFSEIQPFPEVAAALLSLDLLITVDTALAHVAGALGVPVWNLVTHVPDWRWLVDGDDSPWYPTLRLFRQTRPGDWSNVINNVKSALKDHSDC